MHFIKRHLLPTNTPVISRSKTIPHLQSFTTTRPTLRKHPVLPYAKLVSSPTFPPLHSQQDHHPQHPPYSPRERSHSCNRIRSTTSKPAQSDQTYPSQFKHHTNSSINSCSNSRGRRSTIRPMHHHPHPFQLNTPPTPPTKTTRGSAPLPRTMRNATS